MPTQEDDWDATIPHTQYPTLSNRSVLIRGPSQSFWNKDPARYHKDSFCEKTKLVHETFQTDIASAPTRCFSYWLLVFPEGTHLENHILSSNSTHVKKAIRDLLVQEQLPDPDHPGTLAPAIPLVGIDVHWRIAKDGGAMIRSPDRSRRGGGRRFASIMSLGSEKPKP